MLIEYTEDSPIIISDDVKIFALAVAESMNSSTNIELDIPFLTADQYDCRNCGECDDCQRFCVNCGGEYAQNGCTCSKFYDWICAVCGKFWDVCSHLGH